MTINWLAAAERIRAIAQTGLAYADGKFDLERYHELTDVAQTMLGALLGQPPQRIQDVYALHRGYPTPKVDVRMAAFRNERLLLVRETDDGLWTMPGGWADEHDSPRQAVERETVEESGYEVTATRLICLKDRGSHDYRPKHLGAVYKLFFLGEVTGGEATTSIETSAAEFFAEDAMPELSPGRTLPADVTLAFAAQRDPNWVVPFD
jgi:ADP-ribose pyrophosphatase YjhB (NUDIX family)